MPHVPKVWAWERHPAFHVGIPHREQGWGRSELDATLAPVQSPGRLAVESSQIALTRCSSADSIGRIVLKLTVQAQEESK